MKIRTGFVSNSSSSSFMAIVADRTLTEMKQDCSIFQKEILDFCCFYGSIENAEIEVFEITMGEVGIQTWDVDNIMKQTLEKDANNEELKEALEQDDHGIFHQTVDELKQKFSQLEKENKCLVIKKHY